MYLKDVELRYRTYELLFVRKKDHYMDIEKINKIARK